MLCNMLIDSKKKKRYVCNLFVAYNMHVTTIAAKMVTFKKSYLIRKPIL